MTFLSIRGSLALAGLTLFAAAAFAQSTASVRGTVTDPSGALVPGATVAITGNGVSRQAKTDSAGHYTLNGLPGGKYSVRGDAKGFVTYVSKDVNVATGQPTTLDFALTIASEAQEVQVSDTAQTAVSVDPSQNVGAIVLKNEALDALPDDPDDLQSDLQALAGPAAGPNGAQFFIDGFSGGQLPPKSSIREIRINSNPFSAEFDRPGFGRVEIFTKPGSDRFHGGANFNFGDKIFNTRNPLLTTDQPDFISKFFGVNVGGPITKKSSFFIDFNKRNIDDNALIRGQDPFNNFTQVGLAVVTPQRFTTISPRLDYQLNQNNTLVLRYHWTESTLQNAGVGGFNFQTQAEATASHNNSVQATETAILGTKAVNETRFQFTSQYSNVNGSGVTGPTLAVANAFTIGGAPLLANYTHNHGYELQNITTMTQGTHAIKFGTRLRDTKLDQNSTSNFNGTYRFNTIADYVSGTPSQFSLAAGTPLQSVKQFDAAFFVQDDWRFRPNLTISLGARYEAQTNISDHGDITPRIGIAWAPFAKGNKASKTVIRAGYGFFFDRVDDNLTLNTLRYNGVSTLNYLWTAVGSGPITFYNPNTIPSLASLASARASQAIYKIDPNIKAAVTRQLAIGFDQQLPYKMTLTMNYLNSRGNNELRTRNINAPYPDTVNPDVAGSGVRPYGNTGDLYQYEDTGIFKQQQLITQVNARVNRWMQLSGFYALSYVNSNVNGSPSNQYNIALDYGRANFDVRNRVGIFGSLGLPFGFSVAPVITMNSGNPYNVTIGRDLNNDTFFTERPAFVTSSTNPANIVSTKFGQFDIRPGIGVAPIPINYLEGPGQVNVNLRLSRSFGWGERTSGTAGAGARGGGGDMGGGGGGGPRGGGGGGRGMGGGGFGGGMMGGMGRMGGGGSGKKYTLTATLEARNAINTVNYGTPNGNLSNLALFGVSTTLAGGGGGGPGGGGGGGGGGNSAAGNRRVSLQLRFTF